MARDLDDPMGMREVVGRMNREAGDEPPTDWYKIALESARRISDVAHLHFPRKKGTPRRCQTCRGNSGRPSKWPCATYLAIDPDLDFYQESTGEEL